MNKNDIECDLLIIGAGMTGVSAALFANELGLKTVIAGKVGETLYSSGLIDLISSFPVNDKKIHDDPWALINEIKKSDSEHPYSFIDNIDIEKSLKKIITYFGDAGLQYRCNGKNSRIITPLGHTKSTYCYPETMENNRIAFEKKSSCIIIGLERLRGFSSEMIKQVLQKNWKDLESATVRIPYFDHMSSIYSETVARFLQTEKNRDSFVTLLEPIVKGYEYVGLPAVLGIHNSSYLLKDLEKRLSVKLFEIPVIPPSITGLRLKEVFHKILHENGITFLNNYILTRNKDNSFDANHENNKAVIKPSNVLLATGRFIGKGLSAKRKGIVETVFGLNVNQPGERVNWHSANFFDPHEINLAGIKTNTSFNPIDENGKIVDKNLYAAGSILSGNDWKRLKCGSGVAIASAYSAVQNIK